MKDYFGVLWQTKVEVLRVVNDRGGKVWSRRMCKGITSKLNKNKKNITLDKIWF